MKRLLLTLALILAPVVAAAQGLLLTGVGGPGGAVVYLTKIDGPSDTCINVTGDGDGWCGQVTTAYAPSLPSTNPITAATSFCIQRYGYDTGMGATTGDTPSSVNDCGYGLVMRVHQVVQASWTTTTPFPYTFSSSPSNVALNRWVFQNDIPAGGVTNNSDVARPTPNAMWLMTDRILVGDSFTPESACGDIEAGQGAPQECAKVIYSASDVISGGSTTVKCVAGVPNEATKIGPEPYFPEEYSCALNLSTLTQDALITIDAEWCPFYTNYGASAGTSCLKSSTVTAGNGGTLGRQPSTRYFWHSGAGGTTNLAATPPVAYVNSGTGVTAGKWSRTDATARATPFDTVVHAMAAISTDAITMPGLVTGSPDCHIIYLQTAANDTGTFITQTHGQQYCAFTVASDPMGSQQTFTLTANWNPKLGAATIPASLISAKRFEYYVRFLNVSFDRGATFSLSTSNTTTSPTYYTFENAASFNGENFNSSVITAGSSTGGGSGYYGVAFTNVAGASILAGGASEIRIFRGVTANGGGVANFEDFGIISSQLLNVGSVESSTSRPETGTFWMNDYFSGASISTGRFANFASAPGPGSPAQGDPVNDSRMSFIGIVMECPNGYDENATFTLAGDGSTGSASNVSLHNISFVARGLALCRMNAGYTGGSSGAATMSLISQRGSVIAATGAKQDIFDYLVGGFTQAQAATHTLMASLNYGVGAYGNWLMTAWNKGAGGPTGNLVPESNFFRSFYGANTVGPSAAYPVAVTAANTNYAIAPGHCLSGCSGHNGGGTYAATGPDVHDPKYCHM